MLKIKYNYKDNIKEITENLIEKNIEFSIDEDNRVLTIYKKNGSITPNAYMSLENDLFEIVYPEIIDRNLIIADHVDLNSYDYSNTLIIGCYPENNTFFKVKDGILEYLYFNSQKEKNAPGQEDVRKPIKLPDFFIEIKDDRGNPIASLSYNLICIYFDIFHARLKPLHIQFLKNLINYYLKLEKELYELYRLHGNILLYETLKNYILKSHKEKIENLKSEIADLKTDIEEAYKNIIEKSKELREKTLFLQLLSEQSLEEKVNKEIDNLLNEYEPIINPDGTISFITEEVKIKGIAIGRFKINLNFESNNIKIYNITKRIGNYDHPHIENGNICLGNIKADIAKMISEYRLFEVAQICKQLLYFYNPSSAYAKIEKWQEVK